MAREPEFHEDYDRHDEVRGSSDRSFGLIVGGACGLIAGWRWFSAGWVSPVTLALIALAAVLLVLGVAAPRALGPLNRLWLKLGLLLNRIVSPLVMGLVFYTTVTPTGLWLRLTGKDPLRLRREPGAESYWIERRPPGPEPETMNRQF